MNATPVVYAALPVMNEPALERVVEMILRQDYLSVKLFICINQPEVYWNNEDTAEICIQNQQSINYLNALDDCKKACITLIDKASVGRGWTKKEFGVGWARKTLMDKISAVANVDDIIISIDADTEYPENYFSSIADVFKRNPEAYAIANPYYHRLTGNELTDRTILRYEIYMRYYAFQMKKIKSMYSFTPLGSAMAAPVWAYRKVGGLSPVKSGEDFYFLQKMSKAGKIITDNKVIVYPAARFSNRVFFGTGPAMIKGAAGDWKSYPIYAEKLFDEIEKIIDLFPLLYTQNMDNKALDLQIVEKFRINARTKEKFVKFCNEKFDGLRILQYLKQGYNAMPTDDNEEINRFLRKYFKYNFMVSFEKSSIATLNEVRNLLFKH